MSRKTAREAAFKTIFEIPFHSTQPPENIIEFNKEYSKDDINQQNDLLYFDSVTKQCYKNIEKIDCEISKNLKSWSLERISKINLSILRLAMCEILYIDDIPYQVSINEAVELAKRFGDDDSPAFINGVLASVV